MSRVAPAGTRIDCTAHPLARRRPFFPARLVRNRRTRSRRLHCGVSNRWCRTARNSLLHSGQRFTRDRSTLVRRSATRSTSPVMNAPAGDSFPGSNWTRSPRPVEPTQQAAAPENLRRAGSSYPSSSEPREASARCLARSIRWKNPLRASWSATGTGFPEGTDSGLSGSTPLAELRFAPEVGTREAARGPVLRMFLKKMVSRGGIEPPTP